LSFLLSALLLSFRSAAEESASDLAVVLAFAHLPNHPNHAILSEFAHSTFVSNGVAVPVLSLSNETTSVVACS
jgi:hypothetical protein